MLLKMMPVDLDGYYAGGRDCGDDTSGKTVHILLRPASPYCAHGTPIPLMMITVVTSS